MVNGITIKLTPDQQKQILDATGKQVAELKIEAVTGSQLSDQDLDAVTGGFKYTLTDVAISTVQMSGSSGSGSSSGSNG